MNSQDFPTEYWTTLRDGRIQCDVCPRLCKLNEGQRGLCFVRARRNNRIVLTSYGRSSGFCVDPVEKKPLNHFLPGTSVLSFGTAGCNLACKFCQNWDMSKSREMDTLMDFASPEQIAAKAKELNCRSVAFTYNDPVIFLEYAVDVAKACRQNNIKTVAVTAAYIKDAPRREFFDVIDAANVDLKAFSESFYHKITGGHLQPVLESLKYIYHHTNTWLELTTLLIPGYNDSRKEIRAMSQWIVDNLGPEVPIHFTAFHPDWKMTHEKPTPTATLSIARDIALSSGIHHAYTGNVYDPTGSSTCCSACGKLLIGRNGYNITDWNLVENQCADCGETLPGLFEKVRGHWGSRRLPVRMESGEFLN